jgi:hypothetical protein
MRLLVSLLLALLLLPASPRAGEPTREETTALIARHNRWAAGLRTVLGGGDARVGAEGEKERGFRFSLALAAPDRIRLQGRVGNLATVFDLSASPDGVVFYLPREREVVRSGDPGASLGMLLPPLDLLRAVLPVGIPPADVFAGGDAGFDGDAMRLVVPPGSGGAGSPFHRVLWLERETGRPLRVEIRGESQLEPSLLVAEFADYEDADGGVFPRSVRVDLDAGTQWLVLTFSSVTLGDDLDARRFRVFVPEGTREVDPAEVDPAFLPESESGE